MTDRMPATRTGTLPAVGTAEPASPDAARLSAWASNWQLAG